jgi:DNA-binding Lrp family transcriptional regulator
VIAPRVANPVELDRLDEQIVRGLQLSPRVPFRRLAEALDVSEQTVARRYRALQRAGVLRVIAIVDPTALGESDWFVRVKTRPEATLDLGRALAQRPDIAWVSVSAGGSELVCAVRSHSQEQRERLLLDRLPRSAAVLDLSASVILRRFVGGSASDWLGLQDVLTEEQQAHIAGDAEARREPRPGAVLTPSDYAMLNILATDGRAPIGALARAADSSPGRAGRRLEALLSTGVVYLDVDLAAAALGYPTSAYLWLTVSPSRLHDTCAALSAHPETPFVAAISGRANIVASVTCRSLSDLYRYVTERVGPLDGVQSFEVSPILRRLKQAGTLVDGDRLADA